MFKREIKPLSEGMANIIAKSINKLQYVEEKASRPADKADGDVKAQDITAEEPVKTDGSAAKAPARKGDQAQADSMEKIKEDASNDESDDGEGLDKVDPKAVKKKFADRKDKDIDNDGDTDSSDEYLHKRRKAISKALTKEENVNFNQPIIEKMGDDDWVHIDRAGSFYNPKKDKIIGYSKSPKDPNRSPKLKAGANSAMRIADAKKKGYAIKEEVEIDEVLDSPEKMDRYRSKAKTSSDRARNSATAKIVRGDGDYSKEKDTIRKREKGLDMVDRNAARKFRKSIRKEELELEEAKNYEIKDGKIHISKANFRKVHKDYKNATKGKERMMALDPKTGGTTSFPVVFTEAKSDYTIYHKTFSSAVQHAEEVAKKRGFEVDSDEWDRKVAMGPRKPGAGKTNSYIIGLMKGGKPTRKKLHMQVYYDEGRYELNMYID